MPDIRRTGFHSVEGKIVGTFFHIERYFWSFCPNSHPRAEMRVSTGDDQDESRHEYNADDEIDDGWHDESDDERKTA
ncbi:hypothetical protein [Rhizobium jaguaris]|uniref:hypothetical protein n=1 Tax=Rhizobium jaguaris TaxID=1312183 RepID=UPI0013C45388|nr:hypothetical protein [Rhizobium jaguaris]